MKNSIILIAFLVASFIGNMANGQIYKNAVGFKAGGEFGATYKHFVAPKRALDFQLLSRRSGYTVNINLLQQNEIKSYDGLSFYYGTGVGYSIITGAEKRTEALTSSQKMIAINGIIGAEYQIKEANLSVALEYNPRLELYNNDVQLNKFPISLSLRYYFE